MKRFPSKPVKLEKPCITCGYTGGLLVTRYKNDQGFVRCGQCDAPLYSVAEQQQAGEVAA